MRKFLKVFAPVADIVLLPFVYLAAVLLRKIRLVGIYHFPACRAALLNVGVFPITNHYYEPQFDMRNIEQPFSENRNLPGINWNVLEQLELLERFTFAEELRGVPMDKTDDLEFYFDNGAFEAGDADFWYQLIRLKKPQRIFEVGSGHSTRMAKKAILKNQEENPAYTCKHVCIEPYEMPWLEKTGVTVLRKKVEEVELSFFSELEENDILFIDSSHIIRPVGDVLFEYLELLPSLNRGVIVHIHDIFSPRNYPEEWLRSEVRFWNEQYLLEAFLSHNDKWKIIGAANFLHHQYFEQLQQKCLYLTEDREPGSIYIQKV